VSAAATPLRAVLFDFAGTLFSDRALRDVHLRQLRFIAGACGAADADDGALRAAYRRGIGASSRALAGRPGYTHRELFGNAFREMAVALGGEIDDAAADDAVDRQYRATIEHATIRPDARATIEELRARGLHVQVVSNIDDEQLQPMIRRFGLDDVLDAWTSSEEACSCKPDARIYEYALAKAGCEPTDALFVGDSVGHDIIGPARLGMTTAWLLTDARPNHTDEHPADHEIGAIRDVLAIVDGRAA
jgi:putative hydrolase of the HAD superfamily